MEQVLARAAFLRGELLVGADDRVADGAFGLALERAEQVAAERRETIVEVAVLFKN